MNPQMNYEKMIGYVLPYFRKKYQVQCFPESYKHAIL